MSTLAQFNAALSGTGTGTDLGGGLQPVVVDYRGAYNNGDGTYAVGSVVLFDGLLYRRISNPGNPGYAPGGTDWQLFEPLIGSPAYDLWVQTSFDNVRPSNPLNDSIGVPSVNFYDRTLVDSSETTAIDWENTQLMSGGVYTLEWSSRTLVKLDGDGQPVLSFDWADGLLYGLNNSVSLDLVNRFARDNLSYLSIDWDGRTLSDTIGRPSISYGARHLQNTSGHTMVDWENATLSSGEVVRVDWSNGVLSDLDGFPMLNWGSGEVNDTLHDPTLNWSYRYLYKQWTTIASGKTAGNVMSNAQYLSLTTTGTYNPTAPANAGMVIYHQSASSALIASMTLELQGATSAINSVPVGGDISFTSRYGVTALNVTYGTGNTFVGTAVTTCAAGATITWRKVYSLGGSSLIARLT